MIMARDGHTYWLKNSSMNVLYIGGFDLPDNNAAAQRVVSNSKLFQSLGYKVYLMGMGKSEDTFQYEGLECRNLQYPKSYKDWYCYLFSINHCISIIEKQQPSIIVAYNYPSVALDKLRKYCVSKGIKIIADCTEWYTPEGNLFFRLIKGWDTKERMKQIHPKLDGIISISRYLHNYYTKCGVKSILLPPLVDINNKKWKIKPIIAEKKGIRLVYAGSPGHKDKLDVIVRTLMEQKRVHTTFTIIGLTDSQFRTLYGYEGELNESISFKGRIPHREVLAELYSSDFQIFVRENNLTTKAGFPTKFVESISAGLPVLTNLTSNLPDYLSDGKNGFILDASSEETLRESLNTILNLSEDEIQMVKRNIDRTTFDYRNYISLFQSFIENLWT